MESNPISEFFKQVEDNFLQICNDTCYGSIPIEIKRIKADKIEVLIGGSIYHRYVIRPEDIKRWQESPL